MFVTDKPQIDDQVATPRYPQKAANMLRGERIQQQLVRWKAGSSSSKREISANATPVDDITLYALNEL